MPTHIAPAFADASRAQLAIYLRAQPNRSNAFALAVVAHAGCWRAHVADPSRPGLARPVAVDRQLRAPRFAPHPAHARILATSRSRRRLDPAHTCVWLALLELFLRALSRVPRTQATHPNS